MYYKAVFDLFRPLSVKVPEERNIYTLMSVDPLFATPQVPYPDFLAALDEQDAAIEAAVDGGTTLTATKRAKEKIVNDMMRKYRLMVTSIANGDTQIILSTGFKHTKPRQESTDMPKVVGLEGVPVQKKGVLKVRWDRIEHASYYEVHLRPISKEVPDGPWQVVTEKPSTAVITDLESLTYYEVMVRAKGVKGYGAFSDVVTLLVI
jgi:hypothetical protein